MNKPGVTSEYYSAKSLQILMIFPLYTSCFLSKYEHCSLPSYYLVPNNNVLQYGGNPPVS